MKVIAVKNYNHFNMQKLECRALSAAYGKKSVLHNVSFEVARGEFVCLCGPNGSGKSTLLSLLAGLPVGGLRVTSGELVPDLRGGGLLGGASRGVTCRGVPRKEAARLVAYLQQNETCAWDFSVLEYVVQGRFAYSVNGNYLEDDYKVARESLGLLGLGEFAERSVHALSGGEFQKVRIARAVAQRPAFLLLDEPAANLDFVYEPQLMTTLRDLAHGAAGIAGAKAGGAAGEWPTGCGILASVHDVNLAAQYADKMIMLPAHGARGTEGKTPAVICGTPSQIMTSENLEKIYGVPFECKERSFFQSSL